MAVVTIVLGLILIIPLWLQAWRWSDRRRAARVWNRLAASAEASPPRFHHGLVGDLPEPARRFFLFAISPGTPLRSISEIRMAGEIGLGTKAKPNYMPMRARQILAPPAGLVWRLEAGRGALRIEGSDGFDGGTSWVRFWLFKTIPIVRVGGGQDHSRAAFGRVVAEAVFWAPAALLRGNCVKWEAVSHDVARATVCFGGMTQTVDVTVAEDGRPVMVVIPRWTDANPRKTYRLQPFGGYLSNFREFDGYRLPTRVEGGNFIGTDAYFPFYKAEVDSIRFIGGR
ncbi:MAG TPA: DUF6544 family protein [Aurantimonas sp.]